MRVPFADTSTYPAPDGVSDEALLMLADILPTGYEVGVLNGQVRPGQVVAVVGAGPIGLAAIQGARLFSPSHVIAIDLADTGLEAAKQFGATVTINNGTQDPVAILRELTGGLGAVRHPPLHDGPLPRCLRRVRARRRDRGPEGRHHALTGPTWTA